MTGMNPGPRDHLVTRALRAALDDVEPELRLEEPLDPAEGPERLARHAVKQIQRGLAAVESAEEQTQRLNALLGTLDDEDAQDALVGLPPRVLTGIKARSALGDPVPFTSLPATPLSQSDLLINAEGQPNIGSELRAELASAESVDLICAFVIWSGVRHLRDALAGVVSRGGRVRVVTTTYMGATEKRAVDELVAIGAEVRVAFDARTTKLHAKAWLLERSSGLSTAFVGSSNLSHTALFDGLEWNVRLSEVDAEHIVERVRMSFESHWASEHFERYDPAENGQALELSLREHNRRSLGETSTVQIAGLDVHPYPHQQRMLDTLTLERERHSRHRNLVVAATGTGKTVVAALDYKQLLAHSDSDLSLLFVAHRDEILEQSMATYRAVLKDGFFGEKHGGGQIATGRHVFAMVQTLGRAELDRLAPNAFDVVVVDEFHHAAAATYDRLLSHLEPKELLGLTATPERMDGKDVTDWFNHRIAVELRLWEAIDQGFLVPFQYYGIADGTDLRDLEWRRGGYAMQALSDVLTGDDVRVRRLLAGIERIVLAPGGMKALGFCVSKEHAHYMARMFSEAGLQSVALTGDDPPDVRQKALRDLGAGRLRCVFSVEVLGEGVDVPNVDTLLLLRPTSSVTMFTQQLGRGLRTAEGKSHLTVLDLIGQHRREFSFAERFSAILRRDRQPIETQVREGFPFLPAGCTIDLDKTSEEIVLENLKAAVRRTHWQTLVNDLREHRNIQTLGAFLDVTGHRLVDVYKQGRSWTQLQRDADRDIADGRRDEFEARCLKAMGRLTHIDDRERTVFYRELLQAKSPPALDRLDERRRRLVTMLAWGLESGSGEHESLESFLDGLWRERAIREELDELLDRLDATSGTLESLSDLPPEVPFTLHARYTRREVIAATGHAEGVKHKVTQGGVLWIPELQADAFFVDLRKAERDYSPTTMYRDYAINRTLFHWESQSRQTPQTPAVQRYINHRERDTRVLLFVRERKQGELGTQPFYFLGPVSYVDHHGERPVSFTWRLPRPMPEDLFETARSVAAA
jgi:superfamily II DNA or RNA helicase/HKD family nuclease